MNTRLIKFFIVLVVLPMLLSSCGSNRWNEYKGQLLGYQERPEWEPINPFGMVYVPTGTLHVGPSDQDVPNNRWQRSKSISIQGFYMDDTEISNNEYRQFVVWVRDSIAHSLLEHFEETDTEEEILDWTEKIDWRDNETREQLEDLYQPEADVFHGRRRSIDSRKLNYSYSWFNWKKAASKSSGRTSYPREFLNPVERNIYPDTLVWIHDFSYSYNEPMTRTYFHHPAFDDYPVVGVSWHQANAFSAWRTKFWNDYRQSLGEPINEDFRLPTESEWEYAARGGRQLQLYPWGGPYTRNTKGCFLANFKPGRGNYPEDGGFYTVKVYSYAPNDFGLYNMAGNVSEWTSSAFYENGYGFMHDMNPDVRYDAEDDESETMKRKVIRGGSWKDISYYIQCGSRHWEYQDTAKCYVGFRNALTFLGRSINDF